MKTPDSPISLFGGKDDPPDRHGSELEACSCRDSTTESSPVDGREPDPGEQLSETLPSESCPEQGIAGDVCSKTADLLPSIDTGRSRHTHRAGIPIDHLPIRPLISDLEIFECYRQCLHRLTRQQRLMVRLHFHEGLTVTEIHQHTGLAKSTVSEHLKAARERFEKWRREERQALLEQMQQKAQHESTRTEPNE